MNHNEYNGWWNYETWVVNLWVMDSPGDQEWVAELTAQAIEHAREERAEEKSRNERHVWTFEQAARFRLADVLKDSFEELSHDVLTKGFQCSLWSDLLGAALAEVNWDELAEHYVEDFGAEQLAELGVEE